MKVSGRRQGGIQVLSKFAFLALTIVLMLSFLISKLPSENITAPIPEVTPHIFSEDNLWDLIQSWRKENMLEVYVKDERLCDIATYRAEQLAKGGSLDNHYGFTSKYSSYPYVLQENIINNSSIEKITLARWLGSPPHRETLEKPYTSSCVKCKSGFCSQVFSSFSTR